MLRSKRISIAAAILSIIGAIFLMAPKPQPEPPPRFTLLYNDENETGIEWQRTPSNLTNPNSCYQEFTGNRQGWRPPWADELASIFDPTVEGAIKLVEGHLFNESEVEQYYRYTPAGSVNDCMNTATGLLGGVGCPTVGDANFFVWCIRAFKGVNGKY